MTCSPCPTPLVERELQLQTHIRVPPAVDYMQHKLLDTPCTLPFLPSPPLPSPPLPAGWWLVGAVSTFNTESIHALPLSDTLQAGMGVVA